MKQRRARPRHIRRCKFDATTAAGRRHVSRPKNYTVVKYVRSLRCPLHNSPSCSKKCMLTSLLEVQVACSTAVDMPPSRTCGQSIANRLRPGVERRRDIGTAAPRRPLQGHAPPDAPAQVCHRASGEAKTRRHAQARGSCVDSTVPHPKEQARPGQHATTVVVVMPLLVGHPRWTRAARVGPAGSQSTVSLN